MLGANLGSLLYGDVSVMMMWNLLYFSGFRDSSAQNHFGPGLLGLGVSAHFSIRDCSAHFSGTARPIFFFFFFFFLGGGGAGQFMVLFCLCASKQDSRNFIIRDINFQTRK